MEKLEFWVETFWFYLERAMPYVFSFLFGMVWALWMF